VSGADLLVRLAEAGCQVTLRPDGRLSLRPKPPPDLLAEALQHREELARLCVQTKGIGEKGGVGPIGSPAAPPPPARPVGSRPTRPGAFTGDPPAPAVHPGAVTTLAELELAGCRPTLELHGDLDLDGCPPHLRVRAERQYHDICALLSYRALLEGLWPVEPPLPPRGSLERERLDRLQQEMLAGLERAALMRPPSWTADPGKGGAAALRPTACCFCSCCGGRAFWTEANAAKAKGWRCATCHPPPPDAQEG
jgi:hypothetical protein